MSCNNKITVKERILCAKECAVKFNDAPIPVFTFTGETLVDGSTYFDSIDMGREAKWIVYVDDEIVYEFGYGLLTDNISEFSNGSTYGVFITGVNGENIIDFLNTLINTEVNKGITFRVELNVKDSTGIESEIESNKYYFTS